MNDAVQDPSIVPPPVPRRHAAGTVVAIVLIAVGIVGAILINHRRHKVADGAKAIMEASTRRAEDLPVLGTVAPFTLTNQSGESVGLEALAGRVWVADTFFTYCGAVCPTMNRHLAELHRTFTGKDEPKFVSITADPGRDKPEAMAEHARTLQADLSRWWFLTGEPNELFRLAQSLLLPYEIGVPASHSNKFMLIDREGQIRGAYTGTDPMAVRELARDLQVLLNSPPKD
jgi:protein SCO1/2